MKRILYAFAATAGLVALALQTGERKNSVKPVETDGVTIACSNQSEDMKSYELTLYPETLRNDSIVAEFKMLAPASFSRLGNFSPKHAANNTQIFSARAYNVSGEDTHHESAGQYLRILKSTETAIFKLKHTDNVQKDDTEITCILPENI